MNTTQLKNYAPAARRAFIAAVKAQAAKVGVTANETATAKIEGDVLLVAGQAFPKALATPRRRLIDRIVAHGFEQTMEAIAYTWFNRFAAIRYMELHGYLGHGYRVLSHPGGAGRPEILEHATDLELPGLDRAKAVELKLDGTKDEELYRLILLAQCNALNKAMPFLFDPIGSETELLLPANLLHTDSLVRQLVESIDEALWQEIEIIGWLYQFYISEKKDQVIGKVVKSEDIPAATQLFTPNWIVKYMVQNSLGAQWLATYPQSPLKAQMEYYIEPAEQTDEVRAQLAAITPSTLNPEELTLIDPACGSGHILVEAYDLFKAIYLERGYRQRDVPKLILEKNLFGLDIDERAAQLTGFALMMKGRADDRRLLEGRGARGEGRGVRLSVVSLVDSAGFDAEALAKGVALSDYGVTPGDLTALKRLFEHATTFGSLIQVPEGLASRLPALKQLSEATSQDLFVAEALKRLGPLVQQAELLAARYDAVVANPPYMGSKYQTPLLKKYLKDNYKGYDKDFFSAFIDRDLALSKSHGCLGFMSPFVWMFISSHEHLRTRLIEQETLTSLVQLEYSGFEGATVPICTFTLRQGHVTGEKGCYIRLSDFRGSDNQAPRTLEAIENRDCDWFFETAQDEFKKISGSPVAYWLRQQEFDAFDSGESFDSIGHPRVGMQTSNNNKYLRLWWEIAVNELTDRSTFQNKWIKYLKGGGFRRWGGNLEYLLHYNNNPNYILQQPNAQVMPLGTLVKPKGTWGSVTSSWFSCRHAPADTFHDIGGHCFYPDDGQMYRLLGFLNSKIVERLLGVMNPTLNYQVGDIARLPLVATDPARHLGIQELTRLSSEDWNAFERSWDFGSLPLLRVEGRGARGEDGPNNSSLVPRPSSLSLSYTAWITQNRDTIAEMKRLEEENNRLFIDAYGLQDELTPDVPIEQITLTVNPAYRYGGARGEGRGARLDELGIAEELWERFRQDTMEELVSYAIGCMMGRYRLDRPGLIYAHSGNVDFDKIYFRGEGRGARGEEERQDGAELSRSDRVAEGDGGGRASVSDDEGVSGGGALRADEPDSASRRVDPVEHRGGARQTIDQGVSQLSFDREGLGLGSGDSNANRSQVEIRFGKTNRNDHEPIGRNLKNAHVHPKEAVAPQTPLTPRPSPLAPHKPLFPADDDGIVPVTDTAWFEDDATTRFVEFIRVAWPAEHLEENLTFVADNLSPKKNEPSRETIRRWLATKFFKDHHLKRYKKRPIYWLFTSGKLRAFQALVYLHRYNEGTLARMRSEYVIPLQGKMAARIDQLQGDIQVATSTAHRKRLEKELTKLQKQHVELLAFDEKLRHYADKRIALDLDDGVKVNYGKFGTLLAEVKAVHGKKPEGV